MKLAVGPLTTGTYVGQVVGQGHYVTVHKDTDGTKLRTSEDKEHEGIRWDLEKVGENIFKIRNSKFGLEGSISSMNNETIELTEGKGQEWIIEPTDVDGEYIACPTHDKSVFVTATGGEPALKVGPLQSGMTRFKAYRVDGN